MPKNDFPKLRNGLEALPIEHSGQRMLLLRDRIGYAKEQLVFSPQIVPVLARMNGGSSIRDLQAEFMRETGQLIYIEQLEKLVQTLDENLFLENERFRSVAAKAVSSYLNSPVRKMYHAGRSYSAEPASLRAELGSFFSPENGGAGLPDPNHGHTRKVVGLVAPHIDLQAGGPCFAHAYKAAAEARHPDTWIVLGTGHDFVENCFALTGKDFETPLGVVRCDTQICTELVQSAPFDILASEYNHRIEHTIEFQAVFLAFMQPGARIVPILCSFAGEDWNACRSTVDLFAEKLKRIVFDPNRSVGILASVDLAHVGSRYGDAFTPDEGTLRHNMSSDQALLKMLEQCRATDFIDRINQDGNERKICGVAPLYMLAKVLEERAQGTVLCHSHATVDDNSSFVTFASMVFYEENGR